MNNLSGNEGYEPKGRMERVDDLDIYIGMHHNYIIRFQKLRRCLCQRLSTNKIFVVRFYHRNHRVHFLA
jgi:hypothetical protein